MDDNGMKRKYAKKPNQTNNKTPHSPQLLPLVPTGTDWTKLLPEQLLPFCALLWPGKTSCCSALDKTQHKSANHELWQWSSLPELPIHPPELSGLKGFPVWPAHAMPSGCTKRNYCCLANPFLSPSLCWCKVHTEISPTVKLNSSIRVRGTPNTWQKDVTVKPQRSFLFPYLPCVFSRAEVWDLQSQCFMEQFWALQVIFQAEKKYSRHLCIYCMISKSRAISAVQWKIQADTYQLSNIPVLYLHWAVGE